jgi:hypothetical protein
MNASLVGQCCHTPSDNLVACGRHAHFTLDQIFRCCNNLGHPSGWPLQCSKGAVDK